MEYILPPIVIGFILSIFVVGIIICTIEKKHIFPPRCDRNENTLQDRNVNEFDNLTYKQIEFYSGKSILRARIYYNNNVNENNVIIFCHGFGAGHEAYITEIDYYVKNCYVCIGFDYKGCKLSDGKVSHFGQSIKDLKALYNYLEEINFLQDKNLYLWGHSWGGYTALHGSKLPKVQKIISLCPFDKPLNLITKQSKNVIKKLAVLLVPFRNILYFCKYGKYANLSSFKAINKSNKTALIIFGEKDYLIGKIDFKFNNNVIVKTQKEKGHNVYSSFTAEEYLKETINNLNSTTDKKEILNSVDYKKITEQDLNLLQETLDFLNS